MATNNAPYCTPEKMIDQILRLKSFFLHKFPACEIAISTPTLRTDNTTASKRNYHFVNHLKKLNIKIILPAHIWCYKIIRQPNEGYSAYFNLKNSQKDSARDTDINLN